MELAAILVLNNGKLVYTLDDAYIHLAVSENLLHGHYGVNLGEYSAPASSILWPAILAPFMVLPFHDWFPLLLNIALSLGTIWMYCRIAVTALTPSEQRKDYFITVLIVILLIPATNLVGLVFTGMEHSLQTFLACLVLVGLIKESRGAPLCWWVPAAIVLGPLVRYENMAVSAPALLYLLLRGRITTALLTGGALALLVAGFSLFLHSLGLYYLPASILAKSSIVESQGSLIAVLQNFYTNVVLQRKGALLALVLILIAFTCFTSRARKPEKLLAACMALGILIHLLMGRFGWNHRYEIYIWAAALLALIHHYRHGLSRLVQGESAAATTLLLVLLLGLACTPYIILLGYNPIASNNIYEQHYQMHRFATEFYKAPVAVNDIGYVVYENDQYVLDLYGLTSIEVMRVNRSKADPKWINERCEEHGVKVAMVYKTWFGRKLPGNWIHMGTLSLSKQKVTPADSSVLFYAYDRETHDHVLSLLREFSESLPEPVRFLFAKN